MIFAIEIAREDEEKAKPKTVPGKYTIRKHEKSRQEGTRKGMVREVWRGVRAYTHKGTRFMHRILLKEKYSCLGQGSVPKSYLTMALAKY